MSRILGHPVVAFLARRIVYSAIVLLGVMVVTFALVQLVPGDPVRIALGTRYTPEAMRRYAPPPVWTGHCRSSSSPTSAGSSPATSE